MIPKARLLNLSSLIVLLLAMLSCEKLLAVPTTLRVGVYEYPPNRLNNSDTQDADMALYRAKASGRNSLRFFDPNMQKEVKRRSEWERKLREAISL